MGKANRQGARGPTNGRYTGSKVSLRFMALHFPLAFVLPFALAIFVWQGKPPFEVTLVCAWGVGAGTTFLGAAFVLPRFIRLDSLRRWLGALIICHWGTIAALALGPSASVSELGLVVLASPAMLLATWLMEKLLIWRQAKSGPPEVMREVVRPGGTRVQPNRKRRSRRGRSKTGR